MLGKVLVTKPLFSEAIELLKTQAFVDLNAEDRTLTKNELIEPLEAAQGVVTLVTDTLDTEVLRLFPIFGSFRPSRWA